MQEIKMEVEVGEQGLSVPGQIIPKFLRRTGVEEKLFPREEVSENETRDRATVCEMGVHFQVEKSENPGS